MNFHICTEDPCPVNERELAAKIDAGSSCNYVGEKWGLVVANPELFEMPRDNGIKPIDGPVIISSGDSGENDPCP